MAAPLVAFNVDESPGDYMRRVTERAGHNPIRIVVGPAWSFGDAKLSAHRSAYIEVNEGSTRAKWVRLTTTIVADSYADVLRIMGEGLDKAATE